VEWLTRWWRELLRDVILTGSGLAVIGSQVFAAHPNPYLLGTGLSLTLPSTYAKIREIMAIPSGTHGGSGSPSPLPGPDSSPLSSEPR
jgi:hypothetical protein